jgi:hypothetical protein
MPHTTTTLQLLYPTCIYLPCRPGLAWPGPYPACVCQWNGLDGSAAVVSRVFVMSGRGISIEPPLDSSSCLSAHAANVPPHSLIALALICLTGLTGLLHSLRGGRYRKGKEVAFLNIFVLAIPLLLLLWALPCADHCFLPACLLRAF